MTYVEIDGEMVICEVAQKYLDGDVRVRLSNGKMVIVQADQIEEL